MALSLVYKNPSTVQALLNESVTRIALSCPETPRLDAEVLLASVLNTDRVSLYRSPQDIVPPDAREQLRNLVARRSNGEPVSYILGRKEFWSRTFSVGPGVMVPRPDTEILVEAVLERVPPESSATMVDMGTGSGAIAIVLALERPHASIIATDISPEALAIARKNAAANDVATIAFRQGDLFEPLSGKKGAIDAVVSNPPYIPSAQTHSLPPGLRNYEPLAAFDGGGDGLSFYRRIVADSPAYLKAGAWLFFEVGHDQSDAVKEIIARTGVFSFPKAVKDLRGIDRVVAAQRM